MGRPVLIIVNSYRCDEGRPRVTRLPAYYTAAGQRTQTRPQACARRARPSWPRCAPEAKPGATLPLLPSDSGLGAARAAGAPGVTGEPLREKTRRGEGGRWCRWAALLFKGEQTYVTGPCAVHVANALAGTHQHPQLVNTALLLECTRNIVLKIVTRESRAAQTQATATHPAPCLQKHLAR